MHVRSPNREGFVEGQILQAESRLWSRSAGSSNGVTSPKKCEKDVVVKARGSVDDLVETASRASEPLLVYSRGR